MATRAIKPKRDEGPMGGWQSMPERAPSVIRAERPLVLRFVAFAALVLTAVGGMAMVLPSFGYQRYLIGPYWGFFWFTIGLAGLIYHALSDREIQYRRVYAALGLVLLFTGAILKIWPPGRTTMGKMFLPYGIPCLVLSIIFLLAVVRHEADAFWRKLILGVIGVTGGVMIVAGFVFSNVSIDFGFIQNQSSNFLQGEGVVLILLGLFYVAGYIAMQESAPAAALTAEGEAAGRKKMLLGALFFIIGLAITVATLAIASSAGRGTYLVAYGAIFSGASLFIAGLKQAGNSTSYSVGMAIGAAGLVAFLTGLWRSLWPVIQNLPPDQSYFVPEGLIQMGLGLLYLLFALGVCSDLVTIVMTRRELAAYFFSPIAYLVILGITLMGWFMFATFLDQLTESPMMEPIVSRYIISFIPVICLIFMVPVLTMRLLSEERRSGSLEVLMTAPVAEVSVVLSKFIASLFFFLIALAPWALYLVALRVVGRESFDYRPMLSFFIALACSGAGFLAIGLFFSSVTKNQIISAVLTFAVIMGLTAVFWLTRLPAPWNDIFSYISYLDLWITSLQGQLAPRYLVFHLSVAVFFLYLTTKVLEARKWT